MVIGESTAARSDFVFNVDERLDDEQSADSSASIIHEGATVKDSVPKYVT